MTNPVRRCNRISAPLSTTVTFDLMLSYIDRIFVGCTVHDFQFASVEHHRLAVSAIISSENREMFFTLNSAHVANCCENFTMGIDLSRLNLCCFGLNFGDTVYRREVVKPRWRDALHDSWKRLRLCLPWNWPFIDRAQTGARKTQDQKMKDQVTRGGKCRTGIRRTKSPSIKSVTWSYIIYLYWRLWTQATASTCMSSVDIFMKNIKSLKPFNFNNSNQLMPVLRFQQSRRDN